ncbi:MAG TPA: VOC family protein [Steroidobacteraceae bacterium]|nr:VOC family protein [Steroidobacteraceae bacterium]
MTSPAAVSALLFVRDVRRATRFYVAVFDAQVRAVDDRHAALDVRGFRLVIHVMSPVDAEAEDQPPHRRESTAIRLDYVVNNIEKARVAAQIHAGHIDEQPPQWAPSGSRFHLGHDPEGNVFGVSDVVETG